jgi:capsular polysaccharide biosynthesis protein
VFLVCVVLVVGTAVVISTHRSTKYSANAILLVNPGATRDSPGSAQEAANLATTYAGLLPADDAIIRSVASATGLSFDQVQRALVVTVQNGTSLLVVSFTATSPSTALIGANATASAISGKNPVSPAIPAGTVVVTKHATTSVKHHTSGSLVIAIGVILGILLGIVLVLAWERADPRFDHPPQVTEVLGIPARLASELSSASALAIMRQWQTESGSRPPRVAFVAGVSGIRSQVVGLAKRFAGTDHQGAMSVTISPIDPMSTITPPPRSAAGQASDGQRPGRAKPPQGARTQDDTRASDDVELLVGGAPGIEGGEAVAQLAGVTALVIPQEAKIREVQRAVATLGELGVNPSWAFLSGSKAPSFRHRIGKLRTDFGTTSRAAPSAWTKAPTRTNPGASQRPVETLAD